MTDGLFITIEVVYALCERQLIIPLNIAPGSCVKQALILSNISTHFPEINLKEAQVGIFGKACQLDKILTQGDRVEIYRPLICNPKQARRTRAK